MDIKPVLGWSVPKGFLEKLEKALSDYNKSREETDYIYHPGAGHCAGDPGLTFQT